MRKFRTAREGKTMANKADKAFKKDPAKVEEILRSDKTAAEKAAELEKIITENGGNENGK